MVAHTLFLLTTLKTFTLELTLYFDGYKQTPLPHMCIFFYFSTVHHLFTLPSHSTLPSSHKYVLLSISSLLTSPPPECTGKNLSIYPPYCPVCCLQFISKNPSAVDSHAHRSPQWCFVSTPWRLPDLNAPYRDFHSF